METLKLTNYQVFILYNTLLSIKQKGELQIPAREAYYLMRDMRIIEPIYLSIEDYRKMLVDAYMVDGEIPEDKLESANKKMEEVSREQVEVTLFLIPLDCLDDLKLTLDEIDAISPLVKEGL